MVSVNNINQLSCNPKTVSSFPHASLQNCSHIQLFADLPHVGVFSLEEKRGSSCCYVELLDLRKHIDDFLCNTVGEELIVRIGAHIYEWQHGDRGMCTMTTILRHLCDETISAPGESFDEARSFRRIVQRLAQLLDRVVEAAIKVHKSVRGPDAPLQFLAGHNPAGLL